jgi:xylulokinase
MSTYLGLDIGTSSVKALLLDNAQRVLAEASEPVPISRPKPLWSEQNPEDWWQATLKAIAAIRAAHQTEFSALKGIGLSGQMHGAVLLDKAGKVLRPAILWNDGRSGEEGRELLANVPDFLKRASNLPMAGFTGTKLLWVKKHEPEIFAQIDKVVLPKDYIRFRLSGVLAMDMSDAGGTLWHDIAKRDWDDVLIEATGLTRAQMPKLVEGSDASAELSPSLQSEWGIAHTIVIAGGAGDNAASAIGVGAINPGQGVLSVGTSGVLFAVTDRLVAKPERGLHSMCHALPNRWHGMAVTLTAASALSWIAEIMNREKAIGELVAEVETFAADENNRKHAPIFIPYLTGERTPHNDPEASAMFVGLRAGHTQPALAYAAMEGVAFCFADDLDVMNDAGANLDECILVGGGTRSAFWGQMFADCLGVPLDLPDGAELGAALGAARLGMLAAGAGNEKSICTKPNIAHRFTPRPEIKVLLAPRLQKFRALYKAERTLRS